ncbi:MAG: hypothetical protein CM1200mP24_03380 [Gammaproteobacteria bacterium]|nr:MAG: hypothetical protein CM1200mP24_03380 [Gammaproteobacteria bacterium]
MKPIWKSFKGKTLSRAAVELAKDWRSDRALRRLEALLAVADSQVSLIISGDRRCYRTREWVDRNWIRGPYAQSGATALLENTDLDAHSIAKKALNIAADICIYTNHEIAIETLDIP